MATEELNSANPVVAVAREKLEADAPPVYTTEAGVRVRIRRVSPYLIAEVQGRIADPPVPNWHNPDKDRDEPNPDDPAYRTALQAARLERARAGADAALMFGLELVDGLPEDTTWLQRLAFIGVAVDPADALAVEFAFKKYLAVNANDLQRLSRLLSAGATAAEVQAAEAGFRGPAERGAAAGS